MSVSRRDDKIRLGQYKGKQIYKMKIQEFGKRNKDTVMLLHGGGLSWWNYRDAAEELKERFHVMCRHYGYLSTVLMHIWFVFRSFLHK